MWENTTDKQYDCESNERIRILECASLPSRYAIHTEYVNELASSVIYKEEGPTGVGAGLIYLLSNDRSCSRKGEGSQPDESCLWFCWKL